MRSVHRSVRRPADLPTDRPRPSWRPAYNFSFYSSERECSLVGGPLSACERVSHSLKNFLRNATGVSWDFLSFVRSFVRSRRRETKRTTTRATRVSGNDHDGLLLLPSSGASGDGDETTSVREWNLMSLFDSRLHFRVPKKASKSSKSDMLFKIVSHCINYALKGNIMKTTKSASY